MQKNTLPLQDILSHIKIKALNPMQAAAMAAIDAEQDLVLLSPTGSGKTLAFLLPLLPLLQSASQQTKALIIVPSRELAMQIELVFKSMSLNLKVTCCYGGHKREIEENNLIEAPALLIGTPGRLADHIRRGSIDIASISTLVLDEFDKSLELGFREEMAFIIGALPALEKTILTSATSLENIPDFVKLKNPLTLNYLGEQVTSGLGLTLNVLYTREKDKLEGLFKLICKLGNRSMIVFCNHRESVERTSNLLKEKDILNVYYHGAMEQKDRDAALCKFRNGTSNVLVTTDLASRGLDIPHLRYIIHYHLPANEDVFTHRNGRTARMDASGTAILMVGPEEKLPAYVLPDTAEITLPDTYTLPDKPEWSTLFIAAGKKDKVNKVDIVGFFSNIGSLKKEDIGLIEVKDYFSFAGIKKIKVGPLLQDIKEKKIKNKKVKIAVAK